MNTQVFVFKHFILVAPEHPHVARSDGGHLIINPKIAVEDRTHLDREQAVELVKITMIAGAAMRTVMTRRGVEIGRINYQDNGNWRRELHVHLYGRALNAVRQPWGHFLQLPPTAQAFRETSYDLEPLNDGDIAALREEIETLLGTVKYRDF
jgi:diadenosine tetraphosphate (Ap4A) HIT family hydrolase